MITLLVILLGLLVIAGLIGGGLFMWLLSLERRGKSAQVTLGVLAMLLFECAVWSNWTSVPAGPFHPAFGGTSFRLYEIIIPVALLARWVARPGPRRVNAAGLWWAAFLLWYVFAAIAGIMRGHDMVELTFEAKTIVYLGGGALLVATVPAHEMIPGIRRLARWFGVVAGLLCLTAATHVAINLHLPLLELTDFGQVGSDPASVYATLGILALAIEIVVPERRHWRALTVAPLLVIVLMTDQRAVLIEVCVALLLIILFVSTRTGRKRLTITPTEVGLVVLVVGALLLTPMLWAQTVQHRPAQLPFAAEVHKQFTSTAKVQSTTERVNQWEASRNTIEGQLLFGSGLATKIKFYDLGIRQDVETPITHNVAVDLLLRCGVVGLLLFVLALLMTVAMGIRAWLGAVDRQVAALGIGAVAALTGLVTKGLVESILEKPRLAVLLGLLIGLAISAGSEVARQRRHQVAADELEMSALADGATRKGSPAESSRRADDVDQRVVVSGR